MPHTYLVKLEPDGLNLPLDIYGRTYFSHLHRVL